MKNKIEELEKEIRNIIEDSGLNFETLMKPINKLCYFANEE